MTDIPDPLELAEAKSEGRLNTYVAITVALLATFLGVCKVKDDNIVQAMQQAQANRIDDWNFYQARNIRAEVTKATAVQLRLQSLSQPANIKAEYEKQVKIYEAIAAKQDMEKDKLKEIAENDQKTYDQLNKRDDQFDLSDASLAIAISLLAVTALTQKRWLYGLAMIPTVLGVIMGLAGFFEWGIHPSALIQFLSDAIPNQSLVISSSSQPLRYIYLEPKVITKPAIAPWNLKNLG
jgi:hypothetical protein